MTPKFLILTTCVLILAPLPAGPDKPPSVQVPTATALEKTVSIDELTRFRLYPHLDRAYRALGKKDYASALIFVEQAEKIAPGYAQITSLKAEIKNHTETRSIYTAYIQKAAARNKAHRELSHKPEPLPTPSRGASLSMRGYAALSDGDDLRAAALLAAAFFEESNFSDQQRRQLARDLGYLHFKLGEQKMAARWWQAALDIQYDDETALLAAAALIDAGEEQAAKYQLDAVDWSRLPRQARIQYHEIAAKLSPDAKMRHLAEIADFDPTADRYYNLGFLQTGAGDLQAARISFAKARFLDPANAEILGALAYTELSLGNHESAILLFEELAREKPGDATTHAQLGYLYKQTGDRRFARYHFEQAIDYAGAIESEEAFQATTSPLRHEIAALERGLSGSTYLFVRNSGFINDEFNAAAQAIGGSQGAFQLSVKPGHYIKALDKIPMEIYGRMVYALENGSYTIRQDTLQAGFGLRVQPLKSLNLVLAAERLVSLGINSRDDWLLRASYSQGEGYGIQHDRKSWFYHNIYVDGALIDPADPDFFGAIEGQLGWAFRLGKNWMATPHLLASGLIQKDDFSTLSLLEAGPGVTLRYYFPRKSFKIPALSAELRLHYRGKLAGSSDSKSGLTLAAAVNY